jgi:transposase
MDADKSDDFFPNLRNPEGTQIINDRCMVKTQDGHCLVIVSGIVLAQFASADRMAEAYAMVHLVEQGWARQQEVARVFGCSARTVRRDQQRFEDGGLAALGCGSGYPKGRWRLPAAHTGLIDQLKAQGHSNREIARRVGVSEMAIRKVLRRLGWKEPHRQLNLLPLEAAPPANPNLSAFDATAKESSAVSLDTDPSHRRADRLLARLGLLEDAPPLFGSATAIPRAGVLLALPVLVASGVFDCAQKIYGSLGPAFYGLRTSLLTLLLMALWRIKRPEGLKEYSPQDLGRVLGLDRAPEVKTLRRKLARLAAAGRAAQFGQALAQQRVALRGAALGFLYTDGHVRVYHGHHTLPQGGR